MTLANTAEIQNLTTTILALAGVTNQVDGMYWNSGETCSSLHSRWQRLPGTHLSQWRAVHYVIIEPWRQRLWLCTRLGGHRLLSKWATTLLATGSTRNFPEGRGWVGGKPPKVERYRPFFVGAPKARLTKVLVFRNTNASSAIDSFRFLQQPYFTLHCLTSIHVHAQV